MTDRKLVLSAAQLLPGRIRHDQAALVGANCDLDALMTPELLANAPFQQISLMLQFGSKTDLVPKAAKITRGWLDLSIDLEMERLKCVSQEETQQIIRFAALVALTKVAEQYGLPLEGLQEERDRNALLPDGTTVPAHLGISTEGESTTLTTPTSGFALDDNAKALVRQGVTVRYEIVGWGTHEDLAKRRQVERVLDVHLRQTRQGHLTGADYGSGTMSVYCEVIDAKKAARSIQAVLKRASLLEGATIIRETYDDEEITYPQSDSC
jgi:immunity protein 39 of polymorphic toxin system